MKSFEREITGNGWLIIYGRFLFVAGKFWARSRSLLSRTCRFRTTIFPGGCKYLRTYTHTHIYTSLTRKTDPKAVVGRTEVYIYTRLKRSCRSRIDLRRIYIYIRLWDTGKFERDIIPPRSYVPRTFRRGIVSVVSAPEYITWRAVVGRLIIDSENAGTPSFVRRDV